MVGCDEQVMTGIDGPPHRRWIAACESFGLSLTDGFYSVMEAVLLRDCIVRHTESSQFMSEDAAGLR
jgi:hypothetical protein